MEGKRDTIVFGVVMPPPDGFLERAVARGLATVAAEQALVAVEHERRAFNDNRDTIAAEQPKRGRKRLDSGVIDLLGLHDEPPTSSRTHG